ncbi:MAG: flagellar basal-body rod protein FlgF [Calditrichaeota bacterium]|nr:MAG: flagellar basal-body rod protein FlgF [Calditrichota bacterium]
MQLEFTRLKHAMMNQMNNNNIVANNLSNVNTTGYKKDNYFATTLDEKLDQYNKLEEYTDFSQGDLRQTGNPLDVALSGRGYFTVESGDKEMYTRNGAFQLDEDGVLRTRDGLPVMGRGGWVTLSSEAGPIKDITINENGDVYADGNYMDTLLVYDFENPDDVQKVGGSLYAAKNRSSIYELETPHVKQGFLEESNVNPAQEMIQLIEIQRQFESMQKMIRTLDDVYRSSVNKVGIYR